MFRQILSQLVALAKYNAGFKDHHIKFFRDYIFTIDTMFRKDRDHPIFATLDDKWMFTRSLFQDAAARAGMRCNIFNGHASASLFSDRVIDLIRLGFGESVLLPSWAADLISEIDVLVDKDLAEEMLFEGCIVFAR